MGFLHLDYDPGRVSMAHDIFISYSSQDKDAADTICSGLEARGIRCWMTPRDIVPGMPWAESIIDALETAKAMLLVFTASANQSVQIHREVERAVHKGVPVIPLRLENVLPTRTMEYFISTMHWLDAHQGPLDDHIDRVAQGVAALLAIPGAGIASRAPKRRKTAKPAATPVAPSRRPSPPDVESAVRVPDDPGGQSSIAVLPSADMSPKKEQEPFVSRHRELTELTSRLARAVEGNGQLAFVVGEAGSGKSTLLRKLVLQGQDTYPELLAAFSVCDAQTGFGDPYLPFSQLLSALVGNFENSKASAVTEANARRLRAFFPTSGRILLEHGPDLIDVLVPGVALAKTAAQVLSKKVGWLDGLDTILARRRQQPFSAAVDQPKLFQQYEDVLAQLANRRPLLLIIDDMQWVDEASAALLYRLTHQLHERRIFLIGSYRADEVSSAARRPLLAKTLQEYKRRFGDIWLDVGPRDANQAREFLDSYVDSYSNVLDEDFRRAFFEVSRGHALFTVELFRALVDRGVLQRDTEGRWRSTCRLELTTLPAKIEGVIEERVSRLDEASAEIIRLACVEGEYFTAQVIARLLSADERSIVRRISEELVARHDLVEEATEVRSGSVYLNRYRFRHALFQQYLYRRLTCAERRILHRDVLKALQEVHAADISTVAIALSRHAREAGLNELASLNLIVAADAALQKFAHSEARVVFADALDSLASLELTDRVIRLILDTVVKYTNASFAAISPEEHLSRLRKAEALGHDLVDGGHREDLLRLARLEYWIGRTLHYKNDLREAIRYYQRVKRTAEEQSAEELASVSTAMVGRAMCLQGYFTTAEEHLRQALPLLNDQQNWLEYIWAQGFFGLALAAQGFYADGLARTTEALELSRRLKFATGSAASQILLWGVYLQAGDATQMLRCSGLVHDIAEKAGDRMYVYLAHGMLSWSHYLLGDLSSARQELEMSKKVREQLGGRALITDWFEALDAEILVDSEEYEKGVAQAEHALKVADESDGVYAKGIAYRALALGFAGGSSSDWARATENFERSVEILGLGQAKLQQSRTYGRWSDLLKRVGRSEEAAIVEQRATR
jgi:predicted ATPase